MMCTCILPHSGFCTYRNNVVGRVFVVNSDPHSEEGGASQQLLHQEESIIDVPAGLIAHVEQAPPT